MTDVRELSAPVSTSIEGDLPDCIAEAALGFGESHGDTSLLRERLEQIAEACPHNTGEGDLCLLEPVAAKIGIVAVESEQGQWWPKQALRDQAMYPEKILGQKLLRHRTATCMDYEKASVTVTTDDEEPVIPLRDSQSLIALMHVQASANLIDRIEEYAAELYSWRQPTPAQQALSALKRIVGGGMSHDKVGIRAVLKIDGNNLNVVEEIDSLVLHGNNERPVIPRDRLAVPEDRIVLPYSRRRSVDVTLTEEDVHAFSHRT